MILYAIGQPGQEIRMIVETAAHTIAAHQCGQGEVAIVIDKRCHGSISADGSSFLAAGVNMGDELMRIRSQRTALLSACDWRMTIDASLSETEKTAWAAYRQALRDITDTQPDVTFAEIVWPEPPA